MSVDGDTIELDADGLADLLETLAQGGQDDAENGRMTLIGVDVLVARIITFVGWPVIVVATVTFMAVADPNPVDRAALGLTRELVLACTAVAAADWAVRRAYKLHDDSRKRYATDWRALHAAATEHRNRMQAEAAESHSRILQAMEQRGTEERQVAEAILMRVAEQRAVQHERFTEMLRNVEANMIEARGTCALGVFSGRPAREDEARSEAAYAAVSDDRALDLYARGYADGLARRPMRDEPPQSPQRIGFDHSPS